MNKPDESWRLFVAIELPASVRHEVRQHIDRLRDAVPTARASWAREENLHLTLKFLGDTPLPKVEGLSAAIQLAANAVPPFELIVEGCGAFSTRGKPHVLWIGINDSSKRLNDFYQALENECAKLGFPREQRPFHPHLTIARLQKSHDSRGLAEAHREMGFDPVSVMAQDVCLIRSELRSEGSRYTVTSRHAFDSST
jgi:2'-5' RNA ligase